MNDRFHYDPTAYREQVIRIAEHAVPPGSASTADAGPACSRSSRRHSGPSGEGFSRRATPGRASSTALWAIRVRLLLHIVEASVGTHVDGRGGCPSPLEGRRSAQRG